MGYISKLSFVPNKEGENASLSYPFIHIVMKIHTEFSQPLYYCYFYIMTMKLRSLDANL